MKWLLGMALSGYGLGLMLLSPIMGVVALRRELADYDDPLWEAVLGAGTFAALLLLFGYGTFKLGRWMLRGAERPTISVYCAASWLVLLGGVGLMMTGVAVWRQGNMKTGATALSGGFTVAAVGFGMVRDR